MFIFITICGISLNKHQSNEYVIVIIFFRGIDDIKRKIRVEFIKKIRFINEFKTNVLIEIDILISKKFVLNFKNETTTIKNCKVTIFIITKRRSNFKINRIMNFKKTIVISSQTILSIKIHHLNISDESNFLFKSNNLNFSLYVHVIDFEIIKVILCNEKIKSIRMSQNLRLNRTIELNYLNVF